MKKILLSILVIFGISQFSFAEFVDLGATANTPLYFNSSQAIVSDTKTRVVSTEAELIAANTAGVKNIVNIGAYALTANFILGSGIIFTSKNIIITTGFTLDLSAGSFVDPGLCQVFAGTGTITFPTGTIVRGEWFPSTAIALTLIGGTQKVTLKYQSSVTPADMLTVPSNITLDLTSSGASMVLTDKMITINGPFPQSLNQSFVVSNAVVTSGTLTSGKWYSINGYASGDDFIASGAAGNLTGVIFQANGTAPTWTNGSSLQLVPVIFRDGSLSEDIRPEIFGATADNLVASAAGNVTAFEYARLAAVVGRVFVKTRGIQLSPGTYQVTSSPGDYAIDVWYPLNGPGPTQSQILNVGTGSAMKVNAPYYSVLSGFAVYGNSLSQDGIALDPLYESEASQGTILNVDSAYHGRHGIVYGRGWATNLVNVRSIFNGGLGYYQVPHAAPYAAVHNGITATNCNFDHNGGTANYATDYVHGGVRLTGTSGFYMIGGSIQSNNAWGAMIGLDGGAQPSRNVRFQNVYMEQNPVVGTSSTIGGAFISGTPYSNVEVTGCSISYGNESGKIGYAFYILNSPSEYGYFKEWGNFTTLEGRGGTELRDLNLYMDWTKIYVSNSLTAATWDLFYYDVTSNSSISGTITATEPTTGNSAIFPFTAGWDSTSGAYVNIGTSSLIKQACGSAGVSSGGTIAHGLGVVPPYINIMPIGAGVTDWYASADATNITVTFTGAGEQPFYWEAKKIYTTSVSPTMTIDGTNRVITLTVPAGIVARVKLDMMKFYNNLHSFSLISSSGVWNNDFTKRVD